MCKEDLRPVKVIIGKDMVKGFFHGWTETINKENEGHYFTYKSGIVEREDDGSVYEVDPENIKFMDRN